MTNNIDITEKDTSPIKYAMHYGLYLGIFWAIKYLVYVAAFTYWIHFLYLYYMMNVGTFLLIYVFYIKYINTDVSKFNNKLRGFLFVVLLCFFASFIEAGMVYFHFQVLDPSYYASKIEPIIVNVIESFPYPPAIKASALSTASNSFVYVMSTFFGNIVLGTIIGIPMALLVKKNKS